MKQDGLILLVLLITVILGMLFPPLWGFAQDRPCAEDARRLCSTVEPGNRALIAQCLREHAAELSAACRERMQAAGGRTGQSRGELRDACGSDVQTFCNDVQPGGGGLAQCLREHLAELSPECKTALSQMRKKR
jgi:hypothetical protein